MFLNDNELNTHLYDYQLQQIVECDKTIVSAAISAAMAEVRSYLAVRYDVDKIYSASGDGRDPLILDCVKTIAVWRIIKLANVDILYDKYRQLYDSTIKYLSDIAAGALMPDLPRITDPEGEPSGGTLRITSNRKFKHYIEP